MVGDQRAPNMGERRPGLYLCTLAEWQMPEVEEWPEYKKKE